MTKETNYQPHVTVTESGVFVDGGKEDTYPVIVLDATGEMLAGHEFATAVSRMPDDFSTHAVVIRDVIPDAFGRWSVSFVGGPRRNTR